MCADGALEIDDDAIAVLVFDGDELLRVDPQIEQLGIEVERNKELRLEGRVEAPGQKVAELEGHEVAQQRLAEAIGAIELQAVAGADEKPADVGDLDAAFVEPVGALRGTGDEAALVDHALSVGAGLRWIVGNGRRVLEEEGDAAEEAAFEVVGGGDIDLVIVVGAESQACDGVGRDLPRLEVEIGILFVLEGTIAAR